MKKKIGILVLTGLFLMNMISCSRDDDSNPSPASSLTDGSWKVTHFDENGTDETVLFNGYSFVFNSNSTITATKNGISTNGTWSDGNDNSHSKLIINFTSGKPLDELNDDWNILEQNSTNIKLQHVSGGNGGIDNLTFERIN